MRIVAPLTWRPPVRGPVAGVLVPVPAEPASGSAGSAGGGPRARLGPHLPLEGGGDDLGRQVQVVAQVLDALVRQVPVVVAPSELERGKIQIGCKKGPLSEQNGN